MVILILKGRSAGAGGRRLVSRWLTATALVGALCLVMCGDAFACTVSATALNFGNYVSSYAVNVPGTGTVTVNCAASTPYEIGLDGGLNPQTPSRRLNNGGNFLVYQVYTDPSHSIVWGNTLTVDTVTGTGTGANQNFTVYGLIGGSQSVPGGSYSDSITVTVTY